MNGTTSDQGRERAVKATHPLATRGTERGSAHRTVLHRPTSTGCLKSASAHFRVVVSRSSWTTPRWRCRSCRPPGRRPRRWRRWRWRWWWRSRQRAPADRARTSSRCQHPRLPSRASTTQLSSYRIFWCVKVSVLCAVVVGSGRSHPTQTSIRKPRCVVLRSPN